MGFQARLVLFAALLFLSAPLAADAQQKVRVTGTVRDESNAITLPGIPVEVVGDGTVYTDVDGRYVLDLVPGSYELKVSMEGYHDRIIKLDVAAGARNLTADVGLQMHKFAETVTVTAQALDAVTSSQEMQLIERKNAPVITDNMGSQEMKANGDSDAAAAMSRVTGLSVVDSQYVLPEEITAFGRMLGNGWSPRLADGAPGQNRGAVVGNRFGKLGVIASVTHSYKEQFVREQRAFYRVAEEGELEAVSNYDMQYGTQKAQLGVVGNIAYAFSPNHRLSVENFYSHSGRDEGRLFEGPNTENNFYYLNRRLQFIEEGLLSNAVSGEHFVRGMSNSRVDWRVNYAKANRDEPDLREVLYQIPFISNTVTPQPGVAPVLADESQSGFRLFNTLDDQTLDAMANWSIFSTAGRRPTQFKFGVNYVDRSRDFRSRRFRYIPVVLTKDGTPIISQTLQPEELCAVHRDPSTWRRCRQRHRGRQQPPPAFESADLQPDHVRRSRSERGQ